MNHHYADITSRIAEPPTWWDAYGAPRYGKFEPDACPDIYSDTVALLRIGCQDCGEEFLVEMHAGFWGGDFNPQKLHYGDPPAHGCVGDTMNCDDLEVVEVWHRSPLHTWIRRRDLEGQMT